MWKPVFRRKPSPFSKIIACATIGATRSMNPIRSTDRMQAGVEI